MSSLFNKLADFLFPPFTNQEIQWAIEHRCSPETARRFLNETARIAPTSEEDAA